MATMKSASVLTLPQLPLLSRDQSIMKWNSTRKGTNQGGTKFTGLRKMTLSREMARRKRKSSLTSMLEALFDLKKFAIRNRRKRCKRQKGGRGKRYKTHETMKVRSMNKPH
jgi:hypothetical protein